MPLQNRVDPLGRLHISPTRGLFTGNRGIIHHPESRTLTGRRWTTKSWIICACNFKGRHRHVWGRNGRTGGLGWTELFFLDEVTALAAGHRPCFECRREAALAYADCFGKATGMARPTVKDMDTPLHAQRWLSAPEVTRPAIRFEEAPDGAMFLHGEALIAKRNGEALVWSFEGYQPTTAAAAELESVTPANTLAVLAAGFRPVWHPSAQANVD